MIVPCAEPSQSFLQGISDTVKMDPGQQQALILYYQQQTALRNYLMMLQALNASSPTLATSPVGSAFTPVIHSPVGAPSLQDHQLLATSLQQQQQVQQQQQRPTVLYQAPRLVPKQTLPETYSPNEYMSGLSAAAQLAQLQCIAMQQQEKQEELKTAEDLNLLFALRNIRKASDTVITASPKWETESCASNAEAPVDLTKMLTLPSPEDAPSPSSELCSPVCERAERSSNSKDKVEDDDDMLFIDVESIDDKNAAKGQRKAHIEFYRKLKALRQREKILECQLCHDKIENREHCVRTHVHSHSDTALYRCKICGSESKEQSAMFIHTKRCHPTRTNVGFEDRRDMNSLSNILLKCFPRATPKTRSGYNETVDKIWKKVEASSLTELSCAICSSNVQPQKIAISRHAHSHPHYRCKQCKLVCPEESEMVGHCTNLHEAINPKIHKDYSACTAADVMASVLKKCFPKLLED